MQYSHNKDISRIVATLTKRGWRFTRGRKHGVLIAPTGACSGEKRHLLCSQTRHS